tara:strand:+ start:215 stop:409 length:195 start_codon:yes stop_codon:yes gene_type:complete
MSERLKDFIIKENDKKLKKLKDQTLLKSRKEVDINGNGTTGYVIKEGPQKGKVLKHITITPKNI